MGNNEIAGTVYDQTTGKTYPGCRGSGPNGMCNFNEFARYNEDPAHANEYRFGSEGGRDTVNPDPEILGRDLHSWGYHNLCPFYVDQELADKATTNFYNGGSGQVKGSDVIQRLTDVTQRLRRGEGPTNSGKRTFGLADDDARMKAIDRCMQVAHENRIAEMMSDLKIYLQGEGYTVHDVPKTTSSGFQFNEIDLGETMKLSGVGTDPAKIQTFQDHVKNFKYATAGTSKLTIVQRHQIVIDSYSQAIKRVAGSPLC